MTGMLSAAVGLLPAVIIALVGLALLDATF